MADSPVLAATPVNPSNQDPAPENAAVLRCCEAYYCAGRAAKARGENEYYIPKIAGKAYCDAMPMPLDRESIGDYIACVTRGLLMNAIDSKQSTHLLYAAQIALSLLRSEKAGRQNAA